MRYFETERERKKEREETCFRGSIKKKREKKIRYTLTGEEKS